MNSTRAAELLHSNGFRSTHNRRQAYIILTEADQPMSADDIYRQIKAADASVSRSTVYRILDAYLEKALIAKVGVTDENASLFEIVSSEHQHHVVCLSCRRTTVISVCPLEEYEQLLSEKLKFTVTGHRLELTGYCEACVLNQR